MRLAFAARRSPAAPYSPLLPRGTLLRRGDALKLATCPTIPPANISSAPGSSLRRCARKFPPALTIDFTGYFGSLPLQPTQGPSVTFLRGRWQNNNKKERRPENAAKRDARPVTNHRGLPRVVPQGEGPKTAGLCGAIFMSAKRPPISIAVNAVMSAIVKRSP